MDYKKDLAARLDQLRHIEGFPIGEDRDILALSDPPHFTACPNPYLADFIKEHGTPYDEATDIYHREPFVSDVSEGKNDPIYNAHSYHTKVPHKAIIPFIEHYTEPGDLVLDAFCGTGMTGVATQLTGRKAILSDISPIAAFIAYNFNNTLDITEFQNIGKTIIDELQDECGWMYETNHYLLGKSKDEKTGEVKESIRINPYKGKINFTIYSDVLISPFSKEEFIFWDVAVDLKAKKVLETFPCPHSGAMLKKDMCERATVSYFDKTIGQTVTQIKQVPVLINYTVYAQSKGIWKYSRFEKIPDAEDLSLLQKINDEEIPYLVPNYRMIEGKESRRNDPLGITHALHFYDKRNLWVMAAFWDKAKRYPKRVAQALLLSHSAANPTLSRMRRFRPDGKGGGPLSGTLYLSSLITPPNVVLSIERNIKYCKDAFTTIRNIKNLAVVSIDSATKNSSPDNSIDYVFTDPPFGDNLMYSELNFLWESWMRVFTNNHSEAIINITQKKGLGEYTGLMLNAFQEYYRVLKPKRWITVVFHNSKSAVWNAIQEGMTKAGFIIASVTTLDKKQGSFKQVTAAGAVANDLIINAYKPAKQFEEQFLQTAGEGMEAAWIEQFLTMQPIQPALERTEKMLYSKMLAYYIQHGYAVRYDARSFYKMLSERFHEDEGYWFTAGQLNSWEEYKKRMRLEGMGEVLGGAMHLFVSDERSALAWLYQFLDKPKNFSDILTAFNQIANIGGDAAPELKVMLDENFIYDNGLYRRPRTEPERDDLSTRRERALLREYERLLLQARTEKSKIKTARREALLFGFESCYRQKRYDDILALAKKLDRALLDGSTELTEFVEAAEIATGGV